MHMAASSLTTLALVSHLVTRLLASLSSFNFVSPTFRAPTAPRAVPKLCNVACREPRPTNDRIRQRRRLAQQPASNPLATQPNSSPPTEPHTTPAPAFI